VTWLLSGEILHNDSLGCEGLLRPGGVNVMTSGDGIAHAEETPRVNSAIVDGVQLWVALPDAHRTTAPVFQAIQCFTPRECDEKQEPYPGPALPTIGGAFQEYLLRFSWPLSFVCL